MTQLNDPAAAAAHRPLRAPAGNRGAVVEPPFAAVPRRLAENVCLRHHYRYDFHGRELAALAQQARQEMLAAAWQWTAAYRDVHLPASAAGPILLAGHQPQLFHPGVWFKNWALARLAEQHGATAVNLVIDSDRLKSPTLAVPAGPAAAPRMEHLAFDRPLPGVAYEDRPIVDAAMFAGFGRAAAAHIRDLVTQPLIELFWPRVAERAAATGNLGAALAQARHQLEGDWGLTTLEVPQGRICQAESFLWFATHLLAELPRFAACYNAALHDYRRAHRLRGAAQPMPDLAVDDDRIEAPLWTWSRSDPRRRRLFCQRRPDGLRLSDGAELDYTLPLRPDGDLAAAVARLGELAQQGTRFRSKALVTTLWARLALGDLFLHGIGGAHYDGLTDVLIARFFGLAPPAFMVLSATLHLPAARPLVDAHDLRVLRRQLREMTYHPESYLAGPAAADAAVQSLVAAKRQWIETPAALTADRARCRAIRAINDALQPHVAAQRARIEQLAAETAHALAAERVLAWREYAFCLYPETLLREFLSGLLPKNA